MEVMRAALVDMVRNGLRCDLNPTLMGAPARAAFQTEDGRKLTEFYTTYLERIDSTLRQRARRALGPLCDAPVRISTGEPALTQPCDLSRGHSGPCLAYSLLSLLGGGAR